MRALGVILVSWLAWGGCAGERKSTGIVASDAADEVMGTLYKLEFSAINVAQDGSGDTSVEVKLKSGKALVIDGKSSRSRVTLKYLVRDDNGDYHFEHFEYGGEQRLQRGATTFRVNLKAGAAHQLRVETIVDNKQIWGQSGVIKVLDTEEDDIIEENL